MTHQQVYEILHKMLDNYMGTMEDCSIWELENTPMTIDYATDLLYKAIKEGG
jgi:hypothetical protein